MKLRNRLTLYILALSVGAVLLTTGFIMKIFEVGFRHHLHAERELRFQTIISDIGGITTENGELMSTEELSHYVRNERVDIKILNNDGKMVSYFHGLPDDLPTDAVESKEYRLVTKTHKYLGSLVISYDREDSDLERTVSDFQSKVRVNVMLLLIPVSLAALSLAYLISKKITQPVLQIQAQTDRLRDKEYDLDLPDSNIREIRDLSENIRLLAHELEEQENIRREYAQDVSHELRTPLTNLQLQIESIRDGFMTLDDENIQWLLDDIASLRDLIDRLRDTFHDTAMFANLHFEQVDLSVALESQLKRFESSIASIDGKLITAIEPHIGILTDLSLFERIVDNLVSNAIKAISEGGYVRVGLSRVGDGILLSVRDNGVGISKEDVGRIFDRFYRVDNARNAKTGGQGLGLTITKNIIDRLNGTIEVSGKPGKGTEFQVFLPSAGKAPSPAKKQNA